MRKLLLVMIIMLSSPFAFAQGGKPQCLENTIHADTPYGEGELSKLFLSVYKASLWTDAKDWSMDSVFALSIKYDMSFDNGELVDRSMSEMQHVDPVPADKFEPFRQQLTKVFPNVKKGDTITALYDPKKGLAFFHNDKPCGTIRDQDLSKRFVSIWLAPNSSEPDLRTSLLGAHNG